MRIAVEDMRSELGETASTFLDVVEDLDVYLESQFTMLQAEAKENRETINQQSFFFYNVRIQKLMYNESAHIQLIFLLANFWSND